MSNIYPSITVPTITTTNNVSYGKELDFDFANEDFIMVDGEPKVVEGVEALRVWIEKVLRTARYQFPIYSFSYGSEIDTVVGKSLPQAVTESELTRIIQEALLCDPRIDSIQDFGFEGSGDDMVVTFTVSTFDGQHLEVST